MAVGNGGAAANYENVEAAGTAPSGFGHGDPGWALASAAGRYDERSTSDDFTQAGNLFRVMTPDAQDRLTGNIAGAMKDVTADVKARQIAHFAKADPAYGAADAEAAKALSVVKEA
jgi:catalase